MAISSSAKKEVVTVWMKVDGMDGQSRQKGREVWSAIRGIEHDLSYPWDPADSSAGAGSAHGSLIVTRAVEPNTPELAMALSKKTAIATVDLEFERDPGAGNTVVYYKIKMSDCRVTVHETFMATAEQRAAGWPVHLERVGFAYTIIDWDFVDPAKKGHFNFLDPAE